MRHAQSCPFCGEPVQARATRCRYCKESFGPPARDSVLDEQRGVDQLPRGAVDGFMLAYLRGVELNGAYLAGADLFGMRLVAADLRGADLGGADLGNADLRKADLQRANLFAADMSDADLRGADLREANLTEAQLSGTLYDDYTLWPEDVDPPTRGAVHA